MTGPELGEESAIGSWERFLRTVDRWRLNPDERICGTTTHRPCHHVGMDFVPNRDVFAGWRHSIGKERRDLTELSGLEGFLHLSGALRLLDDRERRMFLSK